jgi:galactokinase
LTKLQILQDKFKAWKGNPDLVLKVPGRANIIGEHIDYCGATVMPFAIERSMYITARKISGHIVNAMALDFDEFTSIDIGDVKAYKGWQAYLSAAIKIISAEYPIEGFDIGIYSDIPIGAGLSSSSAFCVGIISTIDRLYQLNLSKSKIVSIALQAEHGMGIHGGIMDQYTILHGVKNKALLLDCHSSTHTYIDLSTMPFNWILLNTNVKHTLVDTPYNDKRSQVEEGLSIINRKLMSDHSFMDIEETHLSLLNDTPHLHKRMCHVVSEITRVQKAIDFIERREYEKIGHLLNASHRSLSVDYEVSCKELDYVCDVLQKDRNVIGCRMMGGGFGGSVIALVRDDFDSRKIESAYALKFDIKLDIIGVSPSRGVEVIL